MEIRRANKEDIEQILILLLEVARIHVEIKPDFFYPGVSKYSHDELIKMIDDDNDPIYVACDNKKVLGYLFCQTRIQKYPNLIKRNKTLYIDDLCVDKNYRRQGIGKRLIEFIIDEANKNNYDDIALNCWPDNKAACKYYEKMGFKTRSIIKEYILKNE